MQTSEKKAGRTGRKPVKAGLMGRWRPQESHWRLQKRGRPDLKARRL